MASSSRTSNILVETGDAKEQARATRKKHRRLRKRGSLIKRILITIVVLAGAFALIAAPVLTNYLEYRDYAEALSEYDIAVTKQSEQELLKQLDACYIYNEHVADGDPLGIDAYDQLLSYGSQKVMAELRLPKMGVVLPIYHSTTPTEDVHGVIQIGPTINSKGSSLPVGGPSTHCFLSNVNSLPSSKLFNSASELKAGDSLTLSVCGEELLYDIIDARMTTVSEASALNIIAGEDRVTLILASMDDDSGRFVVSAKRSALATRSHVTSYDIGSFELMFNIIVEHMTMPQMLMVAAGLTIIAFLVLRFIFGLADKAPRELGRLTGDAG